MRRRAPRERDRDYLGWVAGLPCVPCLVHGTFKRGVHVAHLRVGSLEHGKRPTGAGEKPSDQWVLPCCPPHHTGDRTKVAIHQHGMDELGFWSAFGIDPFQLCLDLRAAYQAGAPGERVIALAAARGRRTLEGALPHG